MVKCKDCGQEFDPRESLMGDECQCQMCWEAECDRSWWAYMKELDEVLGPVEEPLLPLTWNIEELMQATPERCTAAIQAARGQA